MYIGLLIYSMCTCVTLCMFGSMSLWLFRFRPISIPTKRGLHGASFIGFIAWEIKRPTRKACTVVKSTKDWRCKDLPQTAAGYSPTVRQPICCVLCILWKRRLISCYAGEECKAMLSTFRVYVYRRKLITEKKRKHNYVHTRNWIHPYRPL